MNKVPFYFVALCGLLIAGGCNTTGGHDNQNLETHAAALDSDGDGTPDPADLCDEPTDWLNPEQSVDLEIECETVWDCYGETSAFDANGNALPVWDFSFLGFGMDNPTLVCHEGGCYHDRNSDGEGWTDQCDPDNDSDGIFDDDDNCPNTPNVHQEDNDLDDGEDGGDACDDDDDNDGVLDDEDNCSLVDNGEQTDTDGDCLSGDGTHCGDACDGDADGDGVLNEVDNCPFVDNTDQLNTDGAEDGGDVCDDDDDNDGEDDITDNCPVDENADQLNTDGDEWGDVCDSDDDNDDVPDVDDNCPLLENTDQVNTDGDEWGDVCDSDDDNDGVEDESDNCELFPNANQDDADADDTGDVCDPDCDGDDLEDIWFTAYGLPNLMCAPGYIDADGDGFCPVGTDLNGDSDCVDQGELTVVYDCNDGDGDTFPTADEICDGIDNDCDGDTDEGTDETLCHPGATCDSGICVELPPECGSDAECPDDGDECNGTAICGDGVCYTSEPTNCDDGNECTSDSCDAATGECIYVNNNNPCDDGDACTDSDSCTDGACSGSDVTCADDGNECTSDSCDAATGCIYVNNNNSCDDGDACTDSDICSGGTCASGEALECDDANACTDDSCDAAIGCVNVDNSDPCDDGEACTETDVCGGGACAGELMDCGDGVCEAGECVEPCTPECTDKDCGSDGCGGTCGTCEEGEVCSFASSCHDEGVSDLSVDVDGTGFTIWLMYPGAPVIGDRKDAPAFYTIANSTIAGSTYGIKANAFDAGTGWLGCDWFLAGIGGLEDLTVYRNGYMVVGTPTQTPLACGGEGQGDLIFSAEDLCLPGFDTDGDGSDNEVDDDADGDGIDNLDDVCPCYAGSDKGCAQPEPDPAP